MGATEGNRDRSLPASEGHGPLLQRDYWGVVADCSLGPQEVARWVAESFCRIAPPRLVRFRRMEPEPGGLRPGETLEVEIPSAGTFRVHVAHRDANSLTLSTVRGHPEAGRITFGAYRNADGEVVFHIRSRARSSSTSRYAAFLVAGEPMQTNTWADFIKRVAASVGSGVAGAVHAVTREVEPTAEDGAGGLQRPTFTAEGR
ncbi:MAG: DUF1990 family protein [Acidobacteriota bacterium]